MLWNPVRRGVLVCLGSMLALPLSAELEFTNIKLSPEVELGAESVRTAFPFQNTGTEPVTLVRVATSCGCTVADWPKGPIEPGESGAIDVVFEIGNRTGSQRKAIIVHTDARPGQPYRLELAVDIPVVATVEPRLLMWQDGEAGQEKSVTVTLNEPESYRLQVPETSGDTFEHSLEQLSAKTWRLSFTGPANAPGPLTKRLDLTAEPLTEAGKAQQMTVFLLIRPGSGPPSPAGSR
ncbi:MAG: DUF1573 domain-containing protein [Opitutales bacterium]